MKVLQINVRLQEGGAANVALDLHKNLLKEGVESQFAYGWGEKGGKSSAECHVPSSFQVGQQFQVIGNLLIHRVLGVDLVPPIGEGRKCLVDAINWADVVHLHVIHSYFLPFEWLVDELIRTCKPVIWTAHDFWILTGRCASTEGCVNWRMGCGSCNIQDNYPSSFLDISAHIFKGKRHQIGLLARKLVVVAPSTHVADAIQEGIPSLTVKMIPNWIDSDFESYLKETPISDKPIELSIKQIKVLIVANNLSDRSKVDRRLINDLLELNHVELHTIGLKSPFKGKQVLNHGEVLSRGEMVDLISLTDLALFTSEKDTFGLVMIEALACGVPVLAIESLASNEVLGALGIEPIKTSKEIHKLVRIAQLPLCYKGFSPKILRQGVLENYGSSAGSMKYLNLYNSLV